MGESFIVRKGGAAGGVTFGTYNSLEEIARSQNHFRSNNIVIDNDFVYIGGQRQDILKFDKNNLALVANSPSLSNDGSFQTFSHAVDNDFIYSGMSGGIISKHHKNNLAFVETTNIYSGTSSIFAVAVDNDFVYARNQNGMIGKFHKGNFVFVANASFDSQGHDLELDNDFIYSGAQTRLQKIHKSNLVSVFDNTTAYKASINSITIDNDFVYVVGDVNSSVTTDGLDVKKFHKGNFVFVENSNQFDADIEDFSSFTTSRPKPTNGDGVQVDDDFVYVNLSFPHRKLLKYHKTNLSFVGDGKSFNPSNPGKIQIDNNFIYMELGGSIIKISKDDNTTDTTFPVIVDNETRYSAMEGI